VKKAIDSKQRFGVALEIAQWLVDLNDVGYGIVRTPYDLEQ